MAQTIPYAVNSFAGGEWDPQLLTSVDLAKNKTACKVMRNFFAHVNGKASNRQGLAYVCQTATSTTNQSAVLNTRVVPFIFSTTQSYVVEVGNYYMRFIKNGQLIMNGSVPYQITTPYSSAVVMQLGYTQSADTIFFAHPNYASQMLQRISDAYWTLTPYPFQFGPWLLDNTDTNANITAATNSNLYSAVPYTAGTGYIIGDLLTVVQSGASGGILQVSDINYGVVSATIAAGGSGFSSGQVLYINQNGNMSASITVNTVNGSGAITGFTIINSGVSYFSANNLQLFEQVVLPGTPTGITSPGGPGFGQHPRSPSFIGTTGYFNIVAGSITAFNIIGVGTGYTAAQNVATSGGTGSGCTVTITVGSNSPSTIIAVGATVTLSATGCTPFVSGHVGALWRLYHYVPNQSLGGTGGYTMTSSGATPSIVCGATWRLITNGTWTGTIWVEKSLDGGTTWQQLNEYFAAGNFNINTYGTEDVSNNAPPFLVRANSSGFSGTAQVTLTCDPFIQPGMVQITSFISPTEVVGLVTQPIGLSNTATSDWSEGAWSTYRGWPSTVEFSPDDRLCWANSPYQPVTSFITQTGNYYSFNVNDPLEDSDSLNINLPSRQLNAINSLIPLRAILALTSGGEWSIESTQGVTAPLTPSTVYQRVHGYEGSTQVRPVCIGIRAIFVQALGKVIRDVGYELIFDSFVGANISLFSNHLFYFDNIVDMCYCQNPDSLVWMVMASGDAVSLTYLREQQVVTFAPHDTYGGFMSCCSIADSYNNYNAPYFVVNRANGQFIEYMPKRMASTNIQDQFFVDCGGVYDALGQTFQNANLDTFSFGPNYAPDYWTLSQSGTVSQCVAATSTPDIITNVENGEASTLLQGTNPILYQRMDQAYGNTYWQGRAVTFNCFVRCLQANCAYVSIYDGVNTYQSSAHPGDGSWQLLSVTATINAAATLVQAQCQVVNGQAYFNNSYFNSGISSISGAPWLNGQTVSILADGLILPQTTVQNGVVSWLGATNYNKVIYGLPYVSQLQPTTPYVPAPTGTMQAHTINIGKGVLSVWNTASGYVGTDFENLKPIPDLQITNYDPPASPLYTGNVSVMLGQNAQPENSICIEQSDPLPITVCNIVTELQITGLPAKQGP